MNKHLWSNPTIFDLATTFSVVNNSLTAAKFLPWLQLPGFPVVTLDYRSDTRTLTATQQPISHYLVRKNNNNEAVPFTWWVHFNVNFISMMSGNVAYKATLDFTSTSTSITIPQGIAPWDFFIGNINLTSYLIVNYASENMWSAEFLRVSDRFFHPRIQRLVLLQTLYMLTYMSHQPLSLYMELSQTLSPTLSIMLTQGGTRERNEALNVYQTLLEQWGTISFVVGSTTSLYMPLRLALAYTVMIPAARFIPWEGGSSVLSQARTLIFFWGVYYGLDAAAVPLVSQSVAKYYANGGQVPDDVKPAVYLAMVMYNG